MTSNKSTIIVITTTICVLALVCIGTVCALSYLKIEIPPELNTLAGGLVGALTAMLVKTSPTETLKSSTDIPPQVQVVNEPNDPIPTTETTEKPKP